MQQSDPANTHSQDQEIAQLKHMLVDAMSRITELDQIGRVFHDFNNILSSSMGYASLASERAADLGDEKLSRYLNNIEKAGVRARDLVRENLDKRHQYREQQVCSIDSVLRASMASQGEHAFTSEFPADLTLNMTPESACLLISTLSRPFDTSPPVVFSGEVEEEPLCAGCGHELRGLQLHLSIKGASDIASAVSLSATDQTLASVLTAACGGHLCESLVQDHEIVVYLKTSAS